MSGGRSSPSIRTPVIVRPSESPRGGPATEEMRGTTSQSSSPSTKRTIDSSMNVKPGLRRVPGVDVRILAFPAGDIVRPVGAYVVVPVRAGGDIHVIVGPGVFRHPVEVPSLPVILRDPAGFGGPHEGLEPLLRGGGGGGVEL